VIYSHDLQFIVKEYGGSETMQCLFLLLSCIAQCNLKLDEMAVRVLTGINTFLPITCALTNELIVK